MPYLAHIRGELLELDALELNEPFGTLLADVPHGSLVLLEGPQGEVAAELDRSQGILVGPGLGTLLGRWSREPWVYVDREPDKSPPRVRIQPLGWGAAPKIGKEGDAASILATLAAGRFASAQEELLHQHARTLLLAPPGEELICLKAIRGFAPFPYQLQTARRVIRELRGRALLCDEVGLGKTVEAGLILLEYMMRGLVRRVLILTPPSLIDQWQEEMAVKFNLPFVAYDSREFVATPDPWRRHDRIIASLHAAKLEGRRAELEAVPFDLVIVDEAHHLRNRNTRAWELVSRLQKKFILLLTATPIQNNLDELYNLVTLLRPGQLGTPREFRRRFVGSDPLQPRNTPELQQLVRSVMVRNERSSVGIRLPRRHAETVVITLSPPERALYEGISEYVRRRYPLEVGRGTGTLVLKALQREAGSSAAAVLSTLRRLAIQAESQEVSELLGLASQAEGVARDPAQNEKALALVRLLKSIGEQAVVFTGFRATQDMLAAMLEAAGLDVVIFHGGMRREEKERALREFEAGTAVLLASEAGGEGRNLQFCRVMVNFDLPWNPMRIEQRIGRLHRIGQQREVYIYTLAAAGTVESYILELLDAKINLFELVVGELDMILGDVEDQEQFEDKILDIWARHGDEGALRAALDALGEELAARRRRYQEAQRAVGALFGQEAGGRREALP